MLRGNWTESYISVDCSGLSKCQSYPSNHESIKFYGNSQFVDVLYLVAEIKG